MHASVWELANPESSALLAKQSTCQRHGLALVPAGNEILVASSGLREGSAGVPGNHRAVAWCYLVAQPLRIRAQPDHTSHSDSNYTSVYHLVHFSIITYKMAGESRPGSHVEKVSMQTPAAFVARAYRLRRPQGLDIGRARAEGWDRPPLLQ
jgi:hypothetical protein